MIESIQSFLLERPWRMFLSLVVVQFILIGLWSWRRTTLARRAVWIGFAVIPLLIALSTATTTTRERIINVCHELARYVEEGNAAAILTRFSDDLEVEGLHRSAFEPRLTNALVRYRIDRPSLSRFDVVLDTPREAVAQFDAACFVRTDQAIANRMLTRWSLSFRLDRDRWLVTRMELIPTPLSPLRDLRSWID